MGRKLNFLLIDGKIAKQCNVCMEVKVITEFTPSAQGFLGRQPSCRACYTAKKRLRIHGIEESELHSMYENQNGACAICSSKEELHIDHSHSDNQIRELLCMGCNTSLGHFKDDPMLLQKAIDYLLKHKKGVI